MADRVRVVFNFTRSMKAQLVASVDGKKKANQQQSSCPYKSEHEEIFLRYVQWAVILMKLMFDSL